MFRALVGGGLVAGAALLGSVAAPAPASAIPPGCEEIPWGFLGTQRRAICDGPIRPDGSWLRVRIIGYPAGWVNAQTNCYGGMYYSSCSTTPGRWVEERIVENMSYVVFPHNVLPNEPGHLG